MTPAQQREYLSELRKQNAEMYSLTGSGLASGRDPWAHPAPTPKAVRQPQTDSSIKIQGPPKPPKAANLCKPSATLPQPANEQVQPSPSHQTHGTGHSTPPEIKPKPKALPAVSRAAEQSGLRPQARARPSVQPKPAANARTNDRSDPEARVTLQLTTYDIPQYRDETINGQNQESQKRHLDSDPIVSIPMLRFDAPERETRYTAT